MSKSKQAKHNENLRVCKDEFAAAQESGDQKQICTASASLGLALFQVFKTVEGLKYFGEALRIAKELDDLKLQIHSLGMKALAFQAVGRYPDAFRVAEEVLKLGEERSDEGLRFDAYASMGQILMESGEAVLALEKLNDAKAIADTLDDPRRAMNIRSAMGNYSLNVGSPERAFEYFEDALTIAVSLGDEDTEIGLLGNLATILSWNKQHAKAIQAFEKVLAHVREKDNKEIEAQTLRHLVDSHYQLEAHATVLEYGQAGLTLQDWTDANTTFFFYEKMIAALYKTGKNEEAEAYTLQAIEYAGNERDEGKELDFLLSLGESFALSGKPEEALSLYMKAGQIAKKVDRKKDVAYLTGRIGFTFAELGQLPDAITYHKKAVELAQEQGLGDLEGEQLSFLAMACLEQNDSEKAEEYCQSAIRVYIGANLQQEAQKAQQLLSNINS